MEKLNIGDSGGLSKIRSLRLLSQKHMEEDILQNLNSIH